jgi:hypothetical protein
MGNAATSTWAGVRKRPCQFRSILDRLGISQLEAASAWASAPNPRPPAPDRRAQMIPRQLAGIGQVAVSLRHCHIHDSGHVFYE